MNRRLEAQKLFDNARRERIIPAQPLEPLGIAQERKHAVGDEIDRGLMSSHEKKHGGRKEIESAHGPVFLIFMGGKARQNIVRWPLALGLDQNIQIAP